MMCHSALACYWDHKDTLDRELAQALREKVVKRPVVIDDAITIRSMAYLYLSYDHRLIDGAYAGAFLNRVQATLQGFDFSIV